MHFFRFSCHLLLVASALSCEAIFLFFRKDYYILSAMKLAPKLKCINLLLKLKLS